MLRNTFYKTTDYQEINEFLDSYVITFQLQHDIFAAHFPQNPIVPGACLLQIATELIVEKFPSYQLCAVKNLKFHQLIKPTITPRVCFQIEQKNGDDRQFSVRIFSQEITFVKMNLQFQS